MKRLFITIILFFSPLIINARTDSLIVDQYFSPYAGSALNYSIYHSYMFVDDLLPNSAGKQNVFWFMARGLNLSIAYVLSDVLMVVQHEIFGHGYRLREYHINDIGYTIGIGWGSTGFDASEFNTLATPVKTAVVAAGMEANAIFSQQIRQDWVLQNQIDSREALLYLITSLDQSEYILGTSDESTYLGNDVNSYVLYVNEWHNNDNLSKSKLRSYAYWDFVDPSLYVGLYSIGNYLMNGYQSVKMPMLDIGNIKYTLCGRLLLAPYGPEFQLQNYVLTTNNQLWQFNLRYGNNSTIQSYGLDIWTSPIWCYKNWTFSNKFFIWQQPTFLKQAIATDAKGNIGIADLVRADYKITNNISTFGEFGYKTAGYIQGLPLSNSWVWRLGFSLQYFDR